MDLSVSQGNPGAVCPKCVAGTHTLPLSRIPEFQVRKADHISFLRPNPDVHCALARRSSQSYAQMPQQQPALRQEDICDLLSPQSPGSVPPQQPSLLRPAQHPMGFCQCFPPLRGRLRAAVRRGQGRRNLRRLPSHPVALPGAGPTGAVAAMAVANAVGPSPKAIDAVAWTMTASRQIR